MAQGLFFNTRINLLKHRLKSEIGDWDPQIVLISYQTSRGEAYLHECVHGFMIINLSILLFAVVQMQMPKYSNFTHQEAQSSVPYNFSRCLFQAVRRGVHVKMARDALVIMLSYNIFNAHCWQALLALSLLLPCLSYTLAEPCSCLNGGQCLNGRCQCPQGFIGQGCQLVAAQLSGEWRSMRVDGNYSYLYYQPQEVNYYKLIFTVCMGRNPSRRPTLFYIETERNDGSLRESPSLFETAKLILEEDSCTIFSTHYISIKRKEDQSFRKIIVGMKLMQDNDTDKYLNTYFSQYPAQIPFQYQQAAQQQPIDGDSQQITVRMSYELYLRTSYYSTFMIFFTALVMLLVLTTLVTFLRKKYAMDADPHPLRLSPLRLTRALRRNRDNSSLHGRSRLRLSLSNLQLFMPVEYYGSKGDTQECSICLLEYGEGDETRVTPCGHRYHRECFDSWWQGNMSCPVCRRSLDFNQEMRQFYHHYLRNY